MLLRSEEMMSFEIYHDGKKVISLDQERRFIERGLIHLESEQQVLLEELSDIGKASDELRQRLQEIAQEGATSTMQEPD
jgi:hypothetical protein